MMERLKNAFAGLWMLPAGPEAHCGDACMEAAATFGWEARVRFAAESDDEQHLADNGEWDGTREARLRADWEALHPQWPWDDAREHVWRAWSAAGTGTTLARTLH